jgi:hypothetical protein
MIDRQTGFNKTTGGSRKLVPGAVIGSLRETNEGHVIA